MKSKPCFLSSKIEVDDVLLNTYNPENPEIENLLLQTGYLTFCDIEENFLSNNYILDFPNNEVREGFSTWLMQAYVSENNNRNIDNQQKMVNAIYTGDTDAFISAMQSFFASIPYDLQNNMTCEQAYQNIMFVIFSYLGLHAHAEFKTNAERMDITIECPDFIYIMELKLDKRAKEAIQQIHEKKYFEPFINSNKQIILMGLYYSSTERNINDFKIEKYK